MSTKKAAVTHEQYIKQIVEIVRAHCDAADCEKLGHVKVVYGAGRGLGARGITIYNKWSHAKGQTDLVEICALGEENDVQLAGTTIHELAHVLAGHGAGHQKDWKDTCTRLGLRRALAGGMQYTPAHFAPWFRELWAALPRPSDGKPGGDHIGGGAPGAPLFKTVRGCTLGFGTKGGKSRGAGSGSRLRLWQCDCGVKVRVASDTFAAHCDTCSGAFKLTIKEAAK